MYEEVGLEVFGVFLVRFTPDWGEEDGWISFWIEITWFDKVFWTHFSWGVYIAK